MNISETIHRIVNNRSELQSTFVELKKNIDEARFFCNETKKWLLNSDWKFYYNSLPQNDNVKSSIPSIEKGIESLQKKIELLVSSDANSIGDLDRVVDRINRGEFNFCFMGAWRQGKSFVLNQLLDLGEYIMPTSNKGATTGTVVAVKNNENPDKSEARIIYYTIDDIISKINDYSNYFKKQGYVGFDYKFSVDVSSSNLEKVRKNLSDACHGLAEKLPQPAFNGNTHDQQLYETFLKLIRHIDNYKDFLGVVDNSPLVLRDNIDGKVTDIIKNLEELRKKICFYDITENEC